MRVFWVCIVGAGALASQRLDTAAWTAIGPGGTVRATPDAFSFGYELGGKGFSAAVLPAPVGVEGMERIRFRVKSDHDTAIAVSLSEKKPGGGDYSAMLWAPADTWQPVELTPADFS